MLSLLTVTVAAFLVHSQQMNSLHMIIYRRTGRRLVEQHWPLGRPMSEREEREDMLRPLVILLNMFVARASLNDSLPESVSDSCRHSIWPWLVAHVLFSYYVSLFISGSVYLVSCFLNWGELLSNPSVQYNPQPTWEEREMAIKYGCRRLKVFLFQLIVLIFAYVVGAYYYKSIVRSTRVDWLSLALWLIEASFDHSFISVLLSSPMPIERSPTELNNHLTVSMDILLVVKMNQFVMMRYAEFHSRACLSTVLLAIYYLICPKPDGDPTESILPVCFLPDQYVGNVPWWSSAPTMQCWIAMSLDRFIPLCLIVWSVHPGNKEMHCSITSHFDSEHCHPCQMDLTWISNYETRWKKRTRALEVSDIEKMTDVGW